ncbi:MAG: hypothetical protein WCG98_05525 [bacterium]
MAVVDTTITGDVLTGTELTGDIIVADTGTDQHASADSTGAENMFVDIANITDNNGDPSAMRISQLTTYVEQGQHYLDAGKASNNKTLIKFGLYITKK